MYILHKSSTGSCCKLCSCGTLRNCLLEFLLDNGSTTFLSDNHEGNGFLALQIKGHFGTGSRSERGLCRVEDGRVMNIKIEEECNLNGLIGDPEMVRWLW